MGVFDSIGIETHESVHFGHDDATGLRALESLQATAERGGPRVILVGVPRQPRDAMTRSGLIARIGAENLVDDLRTAIERCHSLDG